MPDGNVCANLYGQAVSHMDDGAILDIGAFANRNGLNVTPEDGTGPNA
jgi:hypothetical protein